MLADAERAVGIDAPGERRPELAFFPDLARVRLVGGVDRLAALLPRHADHRLTKAEPLRRVRLLAHRVVALGAEAHRQDVIGEPGGFTPGRRQGHVQPDLVVVGQHLHPREAVRVGPHRVVDAREIDVERAAILLEEMRQQKTHFEKRQRIFLREQQLVPVVGRLWLRDVPGYELVRQVKADAPFGADRSRQHDEQVEAARNLPAPQVAGRCRSPVMGAEAAARAADRPRRLDNLRGCHTGFVGGELWRELGIELLEQDDEVLEGDGEVGARPAQGAAPVHPGPHELAVIEILVEDDVDHRQQERAFGARIGRHPHVRLGRRIRQAGVDDDQRRAGGLAFDDPLRVRVEVVPGLEVRRQQQNRLRVGVVG